MAWKGGDLGTASVPFSSAAGQGVAGIASSKDTGVDRVDILEDVGRAPGADELHRGLPEKPGRGSKRYQA